MSFICPRRIAGKLRARRRRPALMARGALAADANNLRGGGHQVATDASGRCEELNLATDAAGAQGRMALDARSACSAPLRSAPRCLDGPDRMLHRMFDSIDFVIWCWTQVGVSSTCVVTQALATNVQAPGEAAIIGFELAALPLPVVELPAQLPPLVPVPAPIEVLDALLVQGWDVVHGGRAPGASGWRLAPSTRWRAAGLRGVARAPAVGRRRAAVALRRPAPVPLGG